MYEYWCWYWLVRIEQGVGESGERQVKTRNNARGEWNDEACDELVWTNADMLYEQIQREAETLAQDENRHLDGSLRSSHRLFLRLCYDFWAWNDGLDDGRHDGESDCFGPARALR
jgi:hypothetical protein